MTDKRIKSISHSLFSMQANQELQSCETCRYKFLKDEQNACVVRHTGQIYFIPTKENTHCHKWEVVRRAYEQGIFPRDKKVNFEQFQ